MEEAGSRVDPRLGACKGGKSEVWADGNRVGHTGKSCCDRKVKPKDLTDQSGQIRELEILIKWKRRIV